MSAHGTIFLKATYSSIVRMYRKLNLFSQFSISRHLGCFHFSTFANNAAIKMHVRISLHVAIITCIITFQDKILEMKLLFMYISKFL